jgi:hypothetical protein
MENFLERLDSLSDPAKDGRIVMWMDRVIFVFLVLMVLAAPHSIAATQTAWITGNFLWLIRLFVRPRPKLRFGMLDLALWAFFAWSAISSVFSYEPAISIDRLRGVLLFLIFYFVYYNVRNRRAGYFLAFALVFSCSVAAAWAPLQKIIGRGVEIHGLKPGILSNAGIEDGFTLLRANGKKINSPEDLVAQIEAGETTRLEYYIPDFEFDTTLHRADLPAGGEASDRLGIENWKRGIVPRATAFYGHWTTLSEVLQLIASLTLGLFAAGLVSGGRRRSVVSVLLLTALALVSFALLLTVTRASQLGFMISAFVILVLCGSRKLVLAAIAIMIPIVLGGLLFLQQTRQVGVVDTADPSTQYRATMWRDGYRLWTTSPRNFVFGIGMDSTKKHWQEWGMFDGGKLPLGHFHSTPVQLAVERGLPALLLWLIVIGVYLRILWGAIRDPGTGNAGKTGDQHDWRSFGVLLGCLGGAIGFFFGGIVHYNLGDAEVAMVFFLLMGLSVRIASMGQTDPVDMADAIDRRKLAA